MYRIFNDGELIQEMNGTISGGLALLVDSADELTAFQSFSLECKELHEIGDRLSTFDSWLAEFARNRREYEGRIDRALEALSDKSLADCSDVERLFLAGMFIRDIWQHTPTDELDGVRILTCVSGTGVEMSYEGEVPALFFHDGSLLSTITPYAPRLGKFAMFVGLHGVAIMRKTGVMPSIHADQLVEATRSQARNRAVFKDLPRLDEIKPSDVANKRGVILLMHGLFSTDMGTFDGFIKAWRRSPDLPWLDIERLKELWRQRFPDKAQLGLPSAEDFRKAFIETLSQDYLVVGWPHDTMTKIDTNAEVLFEQILSSLGPGGPPIIFVCHSRGGLVARKAAVILQQQGSEWADKARLCVTFGTPHRGAALAESTFQYVAAVASYLNSTGQAMSACRVLDYYRVNKRFEGIDDLRPVNAPGSGFLRDLMIAERTAGKPLARKLDILAIGSVYQGPNRRFARLMTGMLGTEEHDLIVVKKSSLPEKSFPIGELTRCGHSDYFDDFQMDNPHFRNVLEKIRNCLEVEDVALKRVVVTPVTAAPQMDDVLRLLRLKRGDAPKVK